MPQQFYNLTREMDGKELMILTYYGTDGPVTYGSVKWDGVEALPYIEVTRPFPRVGWRGEYLTDTSVTPYGGSVTVVNKDDIIHFSYNDLNRGDNLDDCNMTANCTLFLGQTNSLIFNCNVSKTYENLWQVLFSNILSIR